MSSRNKRKLENFDPNQSDPEDLDYGAPSPPRPQRRARPSGKGPSQPRPKKRQRYADSDDDIEDDEDEDSVEEASFDDSEEEEEAEVNPRTGRRSRKVTKKEINYEESDEDVEESVEREDDDEDRDELHPSPQKSRRAKKQSLIVKLPVKLEVSSDGVMAANTGLRRSSRPTSRGQRGSSEVPAGPSGTRRSSRISHDETDPLLELTGSGRHPSIAREGTRSPGPSSSRPMRGGKGLKTVPSAIMEASQETSSKEALASFESRAGEAAEAANDTEEEEIADTQPEAEADEEADAEMEEGDDEGLVLRSEHEEEDDDDDVPVRHRSQRSKQGSQEEQRSIRGSQRKRKGIDDTSDFEPGAEEEKEEEEDVSDSDKGKDDTSDSVPTRRGGRLTRGRASQRSRHSRVASDQEDEIDAEELAEEAALLEEDQSRRRRTRRAMREIVYDEPSGPGLRNRSNKPDYRLYRPELLKELERHEEEAANTATPVRNRRGGGGGAGAYRSLFSMAGPFGGQGFGGPEGAAAVGGADSDSSDDEGLRRRPTVVGGMVGMTPTSAHAPGGLFPQPLNNDPLQGGVGKVKDKKALADADPLGVDQNVTFDGVGGLDDHINKLKEMVALPLLYPEVFQRFHVTPPRGVLFHGPPGTGKTLLARALASSVSSHGKKVTFYMRKGADALSKWVGEAERQLRLLFEEARKNQPSIIFFDEIDGLAPVRSSKQEQIHASIVATLLALMDGMDGRGQVIVIGATNRPDNVDPALRRPGRFDREFYFPLPDEASRRSILDTHTKGWDPPLQPAFKNQLAKLTKGYGGADLRALCTEAALNAVQGTFPQIYSSDKKLVIDPTKINVLAKDFMISVNKIVPSSERAATSGSAPLPKNVEPLLRRQLDDIARLIEDMVPQKRKLTALEEAQFDDRDDSYGFERETLAQDFEKARIYRPRMLIHGTEGMGQQHLGAALLARLELMHVQTFDLPTIFEDSSTSIEATLVRLFKEVRRHKPSVIFIPNVDVWYNTVGANVVSTFSTLLRSLPANDPVLVIGIMETERDLDVLKKDDAAWADYDDMMRVLFGYSRKGQYRIVRPDEPARREYFTNIISYIRKRPVEFPDPDNRKKRKLEELPVAQEAVVSNSPDKDQLKEQKKADRMTLNLLKIAIQPIMDQIRTKHKKFRNPIVDDTFLGYLYQEADPGVLTTDLGEHEAQQEMYRPYELATDKHGVQGLRDVASGKFYYNIDTVMIEKRLSNGYYKRPQDFLADIKRLAKDARTSGDEDRTIKANEMLANVEVDIETLLIHGQPGLVAKCEAVYQREQEREKLAKEKAQQSAAAANVAPPTIISNVPPQIASTTTENSGPVQLGVPVPGKPYLPPITPERHTAMSNGDSSHARQSNGSTVPSRVGEDVNMLDRQDDQIGPRGETAGQYATPMGQQPQSQSQLHSQTSAIQRMAPGSQLADYHNSASTTTSGTKPSDRSNRTSDMSRFGANSNNTQSTNGVGPGMIPDFSMHQIAGGSGGSQLPDTQGETSSDSNAAQTSFGSHSSLSAEYPSASQSSSNSQFVVPSVPGMSRQPTAISSLLNTTEVATPPFVLDEGLLGQLHDELVTRSSGLSVEQLEQVNAALMDTMWREKGQWDRRKVCRAIADTANDTIDDIKAMQNILEASQRLMEKQRQEEESRRRSGFMDGRFTQGTGATGSQALSQVR